MRDLCFFDENNECLEVDACSEVCAVETPAPVAACIASLASCDDDAYQAVSTTTRAMMIVPKHVEFGRMW